MFREPGLAVIVTPDLLSASIYVNGFSGTSLPTREESTGQLEEVEGNTSCHDRSYTRNMNKLEKLT